MTMKQPTLLLHAHINAVPILFKQGVLFGLGQVVGDHLLAHLLCRDLGHPAQFLLGLGGVTQQGFDFGGRK